MPLLTRQVQFENKAEYLYQKIKAMKCTPKIIFSDGQNLISQCTHCHKIGIVFNSTLLGFREPEFYSFCETMTDLDFDAWAVDYPDETRRIVIDLGYENIKLNLTQTEFETFKDILQQATILLQVHQILY